MTFSLSNAVDIIVWWNRKNMMCLRGDRYPLKLHTSIVIPFFFFIDWWGFTKRMVLFQRDGIQFKKNMKHRSNQLFISLVRISKFNYNLIFGNKVNINNYKVNYMNSNYNEELLIIHFPATIQKFNSLNFKQ